MALADIITDHSHWLPASRCWTNIYAQMRSFISILLYLISKTLYIIIVIDTGVKGSYISGELWFIGILL